MDEPYAGFDWDTYLKFWDLVDERRVAGRTVLIVSHFVVDEARFDRIVEIRDGKAWPRLPPPLCLSDASWPTTPGTVPTWSCSPS